MKKYIIGLCGSHGTGKSTVIKGVKDLDCAVNETQISRAVQAKLQWTSLDEIKQSSQKMWMFQNLILDEMSLRDNLINSSRISTLVERTPIDVWAYTLLWCSFFNIDPDKDSIAIQYKNRCVELTSNYAKFTVLPINNSILFEHDSARADENSRSAVEKNIISMLNDNNFSYYIVNSILKKDRAIEVAAQLMLNDRT